MHEQTLTLAGLETTVVGDAASARLTVVLLHGYAMEPADLTPFAHSLGVPALFLFPRGPVPGQLAPGARPARAWWHVDNEARAIALARGGRDLAGEHPAGLPAARAALAGFLDGLPAWTPALAARPLVLGGFSQGGMLACDFLLHAPRPLAALLLLSASRIAFAEWAPLLAARPWPQSHPAAGFPVFVSHGRADDDLAFAAGERLRDCLREAGADVTWVPFDQGHEIPLVVWRALRKFLTATDPSAR